jgi:hypothetical protein
MKRLACTVLIFVCSSTVTFAAPKKNSAAVQVDPCAPIGKSADNQLIYPLACDRVPTHSVESAGGSAPTPADQDDGQTIHRQGLFGFSYGADDDNRANGATMPPSVK